MVAYAWTVLVLLLQLDVATLLKLPSTGVRSCKASIGRINMCAGDDWDDATFMRELRSRIDSSNSAAQLGPAAEVMRDLRQAWVLIFNPGKNDEGVYTLQGRTTPSSSYVLAFEQTDEAQRFADLLQAEGFDLPQPTEWQADQIRHFCESGQFELGIVPTGALLTPPTHNEYDEAAYGRMKESAALDQQRKRLDDLFNM